MWRFALAQMRTSVGRLLAAGLAILLGTGFITASLLANDVLAATTRATALADLLDADAVVQPDVPDQQATVVGQVPGVRGVDAQLLTGIALTGRSDRWAEVTSLPVVADPPQLAAGRLPTGTHEIAVSQPLAEGLRISPGDTVTWTGWRVTDDGASEDISGSLTVTGITETGSALQGSSAAWMTADGIRALRTQQGAPLHADRLLVYGQSGVEPAELARRISQALQGQDLQVVTADELIAKKVARATGSEAAVFTVLAIAFGAVAIGVAAMVIANTFDVLVAQRARRLALLRCAGATRGQVFQSVLIEALILGLVSSVLGVLLGVGLGQLAVWFLESSNLGITTPTMEDINWPALCIPVVVGVVATVVAAIGPARTATRVAPVVALRPLTDPEMSTGRSRRVVGAVLALPGLVLLAAAPVISVVVGQERAGDLMPALLFGGVVGGLLLVVGLLVLAVHLIPPVARVVGGLLSVVVPAPRRATVRMATANAVRNPRRIAATASALLIGVGLVAMLGTGAATAQATMDAELTQRIPVDVLVEVQGNRTGLSADEISAVRSVSGVRDTAEAWQDITLPAAPEVGVQAVDPATFAQVSGRSIDLQPGHVSITRDVAEGLGNPTELEVSVSGGQTRRLPVRIVEELPGMAMIDRATRRDLGGQDTSPQVLLVDIDDERVAAVVGEITDRVSEAGSGEPAAVSAPIELRQSYRQAIDAMLAVLLGLLAVAVVIAVVGVANTLSLSVIERRREHGVLRAIGVTRSQLRSMLAVEGLLIAVSGALVGMVLGIGAGLAGVTVLLSATGSLVPALHPWILLGCVVLAIIAGLGASVLPARSALKVPVVAALATE